MRVKRVLSVAGYVVIAVLAWLVFTTLWLWRNQERVVFQPPSVVPPDPATGRKVAFRASDGSSTFGFLVQATAGGSQTVVVAFHGNADLAVWFVPWAQELSRRAGVTVFVPEYRGYGGAAGSPSFTTAASDALGALEYVRTLKPSRLVLYGHSLGTAIAVQLADTMEKAPDALVLQSPFTSAREMASRMLVPVVPWVWKSITRFHWDTRASVQRLDVPVSVAHGRIDVTVPARMGRAVFDAALRKGELLIVPTAGHNDVAELGGEAYWQWLTTAVNGSLAPVRELEQQGRRRLP
jgi:fermentation-respiration switch protein FrsA (DUF1100 family)